MHKRVLSQWSTCSTCAVSNIGIFARCARNLQSGVQHDWKARLRAFLRLSVAIARVQHSLLGEESDDKPPQGAAGKTPDSQDRPQRRVL